MHETLLPLGHCSWKVTEGPWPDVFDTYSCDSLVFELNVIVNTLNEVHRGIEKRANRTNLGHPGTFRVVDVSTGR